MKKRLKKNSLFLAFGSLAITIALSIMPSGNISGADISIPHLDKVAHFFMYLFLSFCWVQYLKIRFQRPYIGFIFSICVGILMEFIQGHYLPGRFYEINDIIANIIGSIAGLVLYQRIWQKPDA